MSAIYLSGGTLYLPPPLLSFPGYEGGKKKGFPWHVMATKLSASCVTGFASFFKKKKKETYAIRINEYWDLCSWKCRIQRVKKKLRASHGFSVTIPFIFTSKRWILGHIWIVFAAGFCFSRRLFDMQKLMIQSWCWNEFKFLHAWLRKTTLNFKSLHFTFKPGAH